MADLFVANLEQLRQVSSAGLTTLTEAYVGTLRRKYIWIGNEGGQDDNDIVIIPLDAPVSGRWICPQAPSVPSQRQSWDTVDKEGSRLSDLESRSASDLDSGIIHYLRLPHGVPYYNPTLPNLILTTDEHGEYQLSRVDITQVTGLLPFARVDWAGFDPNMIGAESIMYFDPNYFNRDGSNHVSIKLMSGNQPGLAVPGTGIETDEQARINVIYGTGPHQALEGDSPLGGDLSGVHESAVVEALRNIPLTFFPNQLSGKDGYVLTLDVKNQGTPFFYLSPGGSGGSGGNTNLDSVLVGYILGTDGSALNDTTTILQAFQKLQVQINSKISSVDLSPSAFLAGGYDGQAMTKFGNTWVWSDTVGALSLTSLISTFTLGIDATPLANTDTLIQSLQKLQCQINTKAPVLKIEYLTGTSVLSTAQTAIIINSATDCNVFLPPGVNNQSYRIRNVGPGKVSFKPNGIDTVENVSTYVLLTTNAFDLVFYSGNWYIL